jgi:shikimate dehydrogenase
MKLFGLIGYPLTHSFSQAYFSLKFDELGLHDHRYRNFPLEHIEDFPKLLVSEDDLAGLNVTIPYKEEIIPYLDTLSPEAEAIGAVNIICFGSAGLLGFNTDWIGFKESLEPDLRNWQKTPSALILGTGGAAKAVSFALATLGIPYVMVSHRRRLTGVTYEEVSGDLIAKSLLIINTTPLGMPQFADSAPPLDYQAIGEYHLLYDLIYNPAQTPFLKRGEERGARTKNGLDMLHIQAEASWELWMKHQRGFSF